MERYISKLVLDSADISWVIRNVKGVKFWQDQWVPDVGILGDHVIAPVPDHKWHRTVNDYTVNGDYDWPRLHNCLPLPICTKISGVKPPSFSFDDFPSSKHTNDGYFSIISTYGVLFIELDREPPFFPFDIIWKLKTPPRANLFLWLAAHSRLMTNLTPMEHNLATLISVLDASSTWNL